MLIGIINNLTGDVDRILSTIDGAIKSVEKMSGTPKTPHFLFMPLLIRAQLLSATSQPLSARSVTTLQMWRETLTKRV